MHLVHSRFRVQVSHIGFSSKIACTQHSSILHDLYLHVLTGYEQVSKAPGLVQL